MVGSPLIAKAYDATLIKVTDISDAVVGDLSSFRGQLDAVIGDLSSFRGQLDVVVGDLSSFRGQLDAVVGSLSRSSYRGQFSTLNRRSSS